MLAFLMALVLYPVASRLVGFDCGGPYTNVTTISLLRAEECNMETKTATSEGIYLKLLQLADFDFPSVMQCRVSVSRMIFYCGMHSYVSAVHNRCAKYLKDVPYQQCRRSGAYREVHPCRECIIFSDSKVIYTIKFGTSRECNRLLPVLYQVDDAWIHFLPKPIDAPQPAILKPHTGLTWTDLTPAKLATRGIYSEKDIENLKEHIMFPAEKPAMKIAETTSRKIWNGFVTFGSTSTGIMGIFIIIRLVKLFINTLIHGYAIHFVYGCGIHLLGAIWSSVTSLLLHLAQPSLTTHKFEAQLPLTTHKFEAQLPIANLEAQPPVVPRTFETTPQS